MKTIPIEGRCDLRHVAEVALWMTGRKWPPRSKSEIVATAIETLASLAVQRGEVSRIHTVEEALAILQGLGLQAGGRSMAARSVRLALQEEVLASEDAQPQDLSSQLQELKSEIELHLSHKWSGEGRDEK